MSGATAASVVQRVIPIVVGWERLPRSWSVHGDESGTVLVEPVPVVLLETDRGWVLLDTGMNAPLIRDPWLRERFHGRNHGIEPILPAVDGEPLLIALAAHGVSPADIAMVALSHLHNDHAGGLRLFGADVPVWVHRDEHAYGLSAHPEPERHGMFRLDYDDPAIDWRLLDGAAELIPGLVAVPTPGHTPGHQSFVVRLAGGGGYVLAFDAGDLTVNFTEELAVGGMIDCTPQDTVVSIRRLKAIAAEHGLPIIPGHDPEVWPRLMAELTPGVAPFAFPD